MAAGERAQVRAWREEGRAGLAWREGSDCSGWETLELNPGQNWPAAGSCCPFAPAQGSVPEG